jgi:hypothetical protein
MSMTNMILKAVSMMQPQQKITKRQQRLGSNRSWPKTTVQHQLSAANKNKIEWPVCHQPFYDQNKYNAKMVRALRALRGVGRPIDLGIRDADVEKKDLIRKVRAMGRRKVPAWRDQPAPKMRAKHQIDRDWPVPQEIAV